jgi:predicted HicB family RNase H-like nuclease
LIVKAPVMMTYKNFAANIDFDEDEQVFHGRVVNVQGAITFQARTADRLREEFESSVDDYLEFCAAESIPSGIKNSAELVLRIKMDFCELAQERARREGKSIDEFIAECIHQIIDDKD